jgi:hypothetical protein
MKRKHIHSLSTDVKKKSLKTFSKSDFYQIILGKVESSHLLESSITCDERNNLSVSGNLFIGKS